MGDLPADAQVSERSMTAAEVAARFTDPSVPFDEMARAAFEHQRENSPVYRRFAGEHQWSDWTRAPFLPVEAFKWEGIVDVAERPPAATFVSSGTGGPRSRHAVKDLEIYERSVADHFERVLGRGPFNIVAHLPTYRSSEEPSSLVYMLEIIMSRFGTPASRFVDDGDALDEAFRICTGEPVVVFGTAFGLVDLIEERRRPLNPRSMVFETGGMKTYRRDITRRDLHSRLAAGFDVDRSAVWSEYGMCELLSQCYTRGQEVFFPPPWVRFKIVDVENPDRGAEPGYPGLLALFDLANIHSVSAILTADLAIEREDGFELLGRADAAEIRGCNFLMRSDP